MHRHSCSQCVQDAQAFLVAASREVRCTICLDALREPVMVGGCGHTFCRECLERSIAATAEEVCPLCKGRADRRSMGPIPLLGQLALLAQQLAEDLGVDDVTELSQSSTLAAERLLSDNEEDVSPRRRGRRSKVASAVSSPTYRRDTSWSLPTAASATPKLHRTRSGGVLPHQLYDDDDNTDDDGGDLFSGSARLLQSSAEATQPLTDRRFFTWNQAAAAPVAAVAKSAESLLPLGDFQPLPPSDEALAMLADLSEGKFLSFASSLPGAANGPLVVEPPPSLGVHRDPFIDVRDVVVKVEMSDDDLGGGMHRSLSNLSDVELLPPPSRCPGSATTKRLPSSSATFGGLDSTSTVLARVPSSTANITPMFVPLAQPTPAFPSLPALSTWDHSPLHRPEDNAGVDHTAPVLTLSTTQDDCSSATPPSIQNKPNLSDEGDTSHGKASKSTDFTPWRVLTVDSSSADNMVPFDLSEPRRKVSRAEGGRAASFTTMASGRSPLTSFARDNVSLAGTMFSTETEDSDSSDCTMATPPAAAAVPVAAITSTAAPAPRLAATAASDAEGDEEEEELLQVPDASISRRERNSDIRLLKSSCRRDVCTLCGIDINDRAHMKKFLAFIMKYDPTPDLELLGTVRPTMLEAMLGAVVGPFAVGFRSVYGHYKCLLWSHDVIVTEGGLRNVPHAVGRGASVKCCFCGQRGATLQCKIPRCKSAFHLACALLTSDSVCTCVTPIDSSASASPKVSDMEVVCQKHQQLNNSIKLRR